MCDNKFGKYLKQYMDIKGFFRWYWEFLTVFTGEIGKWTMEFWDFFLSTWKGLSPESRKLFRPREW
jgi:hypothetical protein